MNHSSQKRCVLYDSDCFSNQTFGGISHYFVSLIRHLPSPWSYRLSLAASENVYLRQLDPPKKVLSLRYCPEHRKLYHFINGFADRRNLTRGGYDLLHATGFIPWWKNRIRTPWTITVHDLIHEHAAVASGRRTEICDIVRQTILSAPRIIAISEVTRRDIVEFYGIDPDRIDVIHHGFTPVASYPDRRPSSLHGEWPYILFVGQRGGYKNFDTLVKAFSSVSARFPDIRLVCTGRSFSPAEKESLQTMGIAGKVVNSYFSPADMASLYSNATCFVFPSRSEGFGMPVLEAYAADCPVAMSDIPVFHEIGGDGALFFCPDDPGDMADKICDIISDESLRSRLCRKGKEMLRHYSWTRTATLTARSYERLILS